MLTSIALRAFGYFLRGAGHYDGAAAAATFRPHIDDVVGYFDDVQVVLNDDDGVTLVNEFVEDFQQVADILKVEARGRFIQDVDGASGVALG